MEDTQIMDYTQDIDNDFEDDQNSIVAWLEIDHHKYELREGSMKIGRDPVACKIVLSNEKTISKEHAIFEVDKFSVTLTDLGSRNKTRIGKMALKPQVRYALDGKKELRFGAVKGLFIINTHVADTDSDTCSESMLELSSSSPTKNLSANSNNGEDNSMISPTPQTSTKSLQELGKELVSKKSLDYIPETPAAARGSTSSNAGVSQAVVMESPNTQSTPYSNISRVGLKNFISPCSPVHLSPISVSNKPWNTTNLKLNLDCSNADDEESKTPHTSGEKAKKNSGNFSPSNNEENYNSDESTDVEDLFNEDQSKDDSPKAPPKNEPSKQHVVESEERCSSSHKEGEDDDDNTQDILDAFEEEKEEDNTQDILHAFKEPAEEEEDLTENEKQPFDKTESGTIFKKPSPFLKLKKVTPKVKSSVSFNDDDENVYNMPTQRFPMKNEEPDSTFETPTQMFDAPTQVFGGAHTKLDAPTQVFKTPTKVDAPIDVFDAPTQAFDTPTQAFAAPTQVFEAPTQVFEAPTQVFDAPTQVFDAPTQVFDAPTQVFDAPTQVFDAPTQVFDAPPRLPVLDIKTEGCNSPLSPLNSSIASDVGNETTQVFNNDHRHVDDSDENRYPDTVPIANADIEEPLCEDKYPENVEAARISKNCQTKLIAESTSSPSNDAPLNPNIKNENILTEPQNSNTNLAEYDDDDTDSSTSETLLETRENDSSSLEQTVVFAHSQVVSPLSGSNKDSKEQKNNEGTSLNKSNSAFDIAADTVPACEGEKDASDGESDTSETLLINVKDENKSITSSSVKGKSSLNTADTIQFCEDKQSDSDNGSDTSETLLDVNDKKMSTRSPSKSAASDSADDTLPFCQNEKADIDKNNSNTSKTNETTVIISSEAAAALTKIERNSDLGGGTASSERDYNSDESTDIEEGNNEFPHVSKTTSGNENLEKDSFSKHSEEECKATDCQEEYNSDESTDIEEDRQIFAPTLVAKTPEQGHSRACVEEILRTEGKTEVIEDDVVTPAHKDTPTVVSAEVTQDVSRAESDISKLELTGGSDILPDRIDHHNKAESNTNSEAKCLASSSPQIIDTHSGLQEDFQTECSETPNLSYSNFKFVSRDNTPILKSGDDELIPTKNTEGVSMQIREDDVPGTSDSESSIENSAKKSVHLFTLSSEDEEESELNLNPEKRSMTSRAIARHLDFDFEDVETKKSECSEPHEKNTFKDSAVITSNKSQKSPALSSDSSLPVDSTPGRITASLKDSTEIVEKEGGSKNCGEEVKNDHKADSLKPNDVVSETSSNDATKHQTDEGKTLLNHTSTIISNSEKEKNGPSKSPSGSNEEVDLKSLKSQTRQVVKPCNNRKRPPRSSSQEEEIIEPKRGRRLTRSRKQTSSSEVRTRRTDKGNGEILNSPKTSTSSEVDETPSTNDSALKLPLQPALSVEKNGVAKRASSSLPSLEEDDNSEAKRPTTRGGRKRTAPNRYSPSKLLQASSNNGNRRSKRTKVEEEEIHLQDAKTEHDNNYKITAQTSLGKNNKPDTSNKILIRLEKMKPSSCRDSEEKESPSKDKKKKTACEETEGEDKTSKLVMKKPLNEPDNRTRNSVTTNGLTVRGRRTRRNVTECGNTDKIVVTKSPPKEITAKSSCEGFSGNASNTNLSEKIEQSQFDKGSEEKETTEDRKVTTSMKAEVEMEEASKVAVEKQLRELSKRTRNSVAKNDFSAQRRQTRRNVNENSNTDKIGRRTTLVKNNNETPPVEDAFDNNSETERMEQSSLGRGRKRKTFTEDNPPTVCKQAEKENTVSVAAADKPLKASQKCTRNSSPTNDFTDRGRRTRRNMTDHDNTDKIVKGATHIIEIKSPFKGFHRDASDKKLRNERTELSPLNKGGKETSARDKKAAPCKQTEREDIDSEIVANKTLKKVKTKAGNVTATTNDSTTQGRQTRRGTAPSESIRTTIVSGKRSSSRNSQTSERSTASLPQLEAELVVCHPSSSSNLHHKEKSEKEPVLKKTGRRSGGISVSNIKPKSTRPRRGLCELESEMEISTISESSESEVSSNHSTKRPLSPAKSTRSIRSRNRASSPFLKDEVILWSPSQRQALASKRPRVLFTGFKDTKDEKIVKDAGGILVETATECSVLVTNAIKRTCKLMACLGKGIPIVSTEWIKACKQSGNFVDPWNYIVCDRAAETKFGFSLSQSLKLAAKRRLLSGYSIYVTDSVKPTPEEMKEIIVCAGGHFLETPPVLSAANTVVISCPQDKKSWNQYKKLKLDIVNTEFILTGLLKQKILIQENKLS